MIKHFYFPGRFFKLFPFLFLISTLFAQQSINISGVITDYKSGETLFGANVLLYKDSLKQSEMLRGTAANRYGFFSLPSVPSGEYYIFVSNIGYETIHKRIVLSKKETSLRIDFQLIAKLILRLRMYTDLAK